jgi:hypothetical protein
LIDVKNDSIIDEKKYPNLKACKVTMDSIGKIESCQIYGNNTKLIRPLFISEERSRIFESSKPSFTIDFRDEVIKLSDQSDKIESRGFNHFADRSNKYGYIGFNESDYFVACFTPKNPKKDVKIHSETREIIIQHLTSYENVGKMSITIYSSPL